MPIPPRSHKGGGRNRTGEVGDMNPDGEPTLAPHNIVRDQAPHMILTFRPIHQAPVSRRLGLTRMPPMPLTLWRGADSNRRPSGYEPDELSRLLHPAMFVVR